MIRWNNSAVARSGTGAPPAWIEATEAAEHASRGRGRLAARERIRSGPARRAQRRFEEESARHGPVRGPRQALQGTRRGARPPAPELAEERSQLRLNESVRPLPVPPAPAAPSPACGPRPHRARALPAEDRGLGAGRPAVLTASSYCPHPSSSAIPRSFQPSLGLVRTTLRPIEAGGI